jgi:radical SAM protein with 4Fe4S-binding SPASM domain
VSVSRRRRLTAFTVDSAGDVYSCPEGEGPEAHEHWHDCRLGNIAGGPQTKAHRRKARCSSCPEFGLCGGRCIWSDDDAFCLTTRHAIRLVREHAADIAGLFPGGQLDGHLLSAVLNSEIVP